MKNVANHPITWSVQSVTQYDLSAHSSLGTFNREFYAYTPLNPHSSYFTGYQVRDGLADDPSFEAKDGLFRLHWLYLENEVWLDSPGGWLAVVDRATTYAMVERFKYQPAAEYPGKASVIFYKNGVSIGVDKDLVPKLSVTSPEETPYYMEAELNSPMVSLRPGETYRFDTEWFPTRAANEFSTVTEAGVVEVPATVKSDGKDLFITGVFGVFFSGTVQARFLDKSGTELGKAIVAKANPLVLLELNAPLNPPLHTAKVSLHLIDEAGADRGVLGEAETKQNAEGDAA